MMRRSALPVGAAVSLRMEREVANRWGIPKAVEDLVEQRDKACIYCGIQFGSDRKTKKSWEHIVNDIRMCMVDNVALCCVSCNASKGAKPLKRWLETAGAIRKGVSPATLAPVALEALERED